MIEDIWIVARKELLEALANPRTRQQTIATALIVILFVDLGPTLLARSYMISVGVAFGLTAFGMIMTPLMTTADAIAGERERHTLETMLATRLPDAAIALGKILALLIIAVGTTGILLLQAIVVISALFGRWAEFPLLLASAFGALISGVIVSLFLCCIGILVSMRAETVQGAATALSMVMMPLFLLPALVIPAVSFGNFEIFDFIMRNAALVIGGILVAAVLLDILFLWIVAKAFRRPRLMRS